MDGTIEDTNSSGLKNHSGPKQREQEHEGAEKGTEEKTGVAFCLCPVHDRRLDNDDRVRWKVGGCMGDEAGGGTEAMGGTGNGYANLGVANETNLDSLASSSSES